ncbi:MAG: glycoside hydrolase family 30 beta sandwich domain-containing protein [Bacteroidales bacterium]
MKNAFPFIIIFCLAALCHSCKEKPGSDVEDPVVYTLAVDPTVTYQEMIGFGGSLTWYSERIMTSPDKNKICQLLFEDMGMDIVRFKNNYYPQGYPAVKTTDVMENSGLKSLFTVTGQLNDIAKLYNPGILTLISSWTPPSALKSNNNLRQGTLKKEGGAYMYEAFANYWVDMLDNLSFNPDYISIQNEPSWITPDWETCEWRPTETADFPGYVNAFDLVYEKIGTRPNPPKLIGPEAENLGVSKFGGNTFEAFSDPIRDKPHLAAYAYHTYNWSATTPISETTSMLNMVRDNYGNKPCIMTEYSNFSWLKTAQFIINNINEANASAYLYWLMAWDDANALSMIRITNSGSFTVTPFYYVMKHFAKNVDKGYDRVNATSSTSSIKFSAFANPSGTKITVVIVNPLSTPAYVDFTVKNKTIKTVSAVQTVEGSMYKDLGAIAADKYFTLKPSSVTTAVIDLQ